jgi:hypothetical protein
VVEEPEDLRAELKEIGRMKYHRFRHVAALLNYYRIERHTIEDRLIERGCSRELAEWIVRTASDDVRLTKRIEHTEVPESTAQILLKGLNGFVTLVIVFLVTRYVQYTENLGLLVVLGPLLLIGSLIGSLVILRSLLELRKRFAERE